MMMFVAECAGVFQINKSCDSFILDLKAMYTYTLVLSVFP